jgi:3-[(4R)-4-hydroxycyclohexa-1,5-dien-1-yl]-2-oxopropanoate isomerase
MKPPVDDAAFPEADETVDEDGIRTRSYRRGGTEVKVSRIPPGARIPRHAHPEAQLGLLVSGRLDVVVGDVRKEMRARRDCYVAPPDVPHAAVNASDDEVVALDLKRLVPGERYTAPDDFFFRSIHDADEVSFRHDWLDLTLVALPPGEGMPAHDHAHELVGICIDGAYMATVGDQTRSMTAGDVHISLAGERHGATNPHGSPAAFVRVSLRPRS